ncbi:hypothetical protein [Arthrobacter sp. ISL-69]|uniref:hypothetical protein n=1 Tax=Arthrobacter sp. ISL-69 TaxID=2819113 RepID=UPI001BE7A8F6|nr:hypothetical protein [Arthrobacter sp. ISL-69]MBT2535345.1 hypothetical protein [Arthrobacter sp. ISL-69]
MHRSAPSAIAVSGALGLAFLLVACGPPASSPSTNSPDTTSTASATPTPASTSPSATASTSAPSDPEAGWKSHTTADGLIFDYPAEWKITDPAGEAAPGGVFVNITNANGKNLATLRTNMVTGSECTEKQPFGVYESEPVPALEQDGRVPRYTFETRTDTTATDPKLMTLFAYGITTAPEPSGTEACPIFHFFTWPPSGAMFGGVYDPFDTTPGNEMHVDTPEAYTGTQEYKNIKKMITSLRPAA